MFNHVQLYRFEYSFGFYVATFCGVIPALLGIAKFYANLGEDIVRERNLVVMKMLDCFRYSSKRIKLEVVFFILTFGSLTVNNN